MQHSVIQESDKAPPLVVRRVAAISHIPEHLKDIIGAASETLSEEQQQCFIELLLTYEPLFPKSDSDLGYMYAVMHKIDTGSAKPVPQPVRRTPLGFQSEEERHLQSMLKAGVINPSPSKWASPVVLARKKDGGLCNYYCKFVPAFAELAGPLHTLLTNGATFLWEDDHQDAFTQLKEKLPTTPVLGYPTVEGKYIFDTDASSHSIGAVLSQLQ